MLSKKTSGTLPRKSSVLLQPKFSRSEPTFSPKKSPKGNHEKPVIGLLTYTANGIRLVESPSSPEDQKNRFSPKSVHERESSLTETQAFFSPVRKVKPMSHSPYSPIGPQHK